MGVEEWASVAGAIGVWPAVQWLHRKLSRNPKADAEARKANAEADDLIATRLWAEIERLDRDLKAVRDELATVKSAAADEKTQLETENKRLRYEVSSLRRRVGQLEEIIKTKTTPEDMRAQLAAIDEQTAKRGKQ